MDSHRQKYNVSKLVRMSEAENEMLKRKADEAGMSESGYVRYVISQKPSDYPEIRKLLSELINEINHIGININQIVKNNNSGFYSNDDKTRLYAYMRKLNLKVDEVVRAIGDK